MQSQSSTPILVTGVPGNIGGIGLRVVENLRRRGLPVRAFVHHDDRRAEALRSLGAEIVTGDLSRAEDVRPAFEGCRRVYVGITPASPSYVEAVALAAAVARERKDLEVLVNMSQMTVSQMSLDQMTGSPMHQRSWMGEQVLRW